jgi:16S rRNA (uracil1498-N3)-methyltransferase
MIPRLYVDAPLSAGAVVELDSARSHYLGHVLRRDKGAPVLLFNGREGEWQAAIDGTTKSVRLTLERQTRPQAAGPDLWLVFAPIKGERVDLLVEKATELGASALQPMFTQHTAVAGVNLRRLRAHAIEAAEQAERLDVPEVRAPLRLEAILKAWPAQRRLLVCAEFGQATPIAEALADLAPEEASAVMTGPEGGFAERELDALKRLPFVRPVGLGPRLLRADTAAIAALACWQALHGDGGQRPPARRESSSHATEFERLT